MKLLNKILCALRALAGRLWHAIRWTWAQLTDLWHVIRTTRFSAFLLLVGAALLLVAGQGREIAIGLLEEEAPWYQWVLFGLAVFWWALQSWFWARFALEREFGSDREKWNRAEQAGVALGWFIRVLPRFYGIAVFGLASLALWRAGADFSDTPFRMLVGGVVFLAFLIWRTNMARTIQSRLPQASVVLQARSVALAPWLPVLAPLAFSLFLASLILSAGMFVWVTLDSTTVGFLFGAAAIAFMAFASVIPVGSLLVVLSRDAGVPVIMAITVYAFLISPFTDNHQVRALSLCDSEVESPVEGADPSDCVTAVWKDGRLTVSEATERWYRANNGGTEPNRTIVFVSTAGGGLRAAYWTATILGRLQDETPDFSRKLFSISGVSGGSLGAAVFAGLNASGEEASSRGFAARGQKALAHDFLGPTLAGLFFPDLMNRLLPVGLPDRAQALELAWEAGWGAACAVPEVDSECGKLMRSPFLALWSGGREGEWRPALLLNGTHQETGRRLITSNLKIEESVFQDSLDFYDLVDHEVRVSTAALNSARFPVITPAGTLIRRSDDETRVQTGHVLDGGYFENYGAETTIDLAEFVIGTFGRRSLRLRPIFVEISSDPMLRGADIERPEVCFDGDEASAPRVDSRAQELKPLNELLGPLEGFWNTRGARGVLAAKRLARRAFCLSERWRMEPPVVVQFRMCRSRGTESPALGWVLSQQSRKEIRGFLPGEGRGTGPCVQDNARAWKKLLAALKGESTREKKQ